MSQREGYYSLDALQRSSLSEWFRLMAVAADKRKRAWNYAGAPLVCGPLVRDARKAIVKAIEVRRQQAWIDMIAGARARLPK